MAMFINTRRKVIPSEREKMKLINREKQDHDRYTHTHTNADKLSLHGI